MTATELIQLPSVYGPNSVLFLKNILKLGFIESLGSATDKTPDGIVETL